MDIPVKHEIHCPYHSHHKFVFPINRIDSSMPTLSLSLAADDQIF